MANPPKSVSDQWELAQKARAAQSKGHDIKTKDERDALVAQRETPRPQRHLTPDNVPRRDPDAERREARIAEINAALQKASSQITKDFEHSRGG